MMMTYTACAECGTDCMALSDGLCNDCRRGYAREQLVYALDEATKTHDTLVARYNREYRAGKWTTNRTLAGKCEDAQSAMWSAQVALDKFDNGEEE